MDISGGRPEAVNSIDTDFITAKETDDYNRAAGLPVDALRHRACPPERLFDPVLDANLIADYSYAAKHRRESCTEIVGCKPKEACTGGNKCSVGYEYQKEKMRGDNRIRSKYIAILQYDITMPYKDVWQCMRRDHSISMRLPSILER